MNRGHYVILWSQGKMMRGRESVGLRVVGVGVEGEAVRAAPQARGTSTKAWSFLIASIVLTLPHCTEYPS